METRGYQPTHGQERVEGLFARGWPPRAGWLWRYVAEGVCVLDEIFARMFALRQPWSWLRFGMFLLYGYWVLIRPYRLYPKPLPDLLPFPYMLLPWVTFLDGVRLMFQGLWQWLTYLLRWEVLRYWALWGGSFALAWWAAARYLWRIFDLEADPQRRALRQRQSYAMVLYRAFAPVYWWGFGVVDGRVLNVLSPVYWFGGPGRMVVGVENAVALERLGMGRVRVANPMHGPQGWRVDGYEWVRRVVDLRDQHLSFDIQVRTRDGVPLVFHDVHMVYSISRRGQEPTWIQPYPHLARDVLQLIRNEGGAARPLDGLPPWADVEDLRSWRSVEHTTQAMRVAFRTQLRGAVSAHTLQEVLAFIQEGEARGLRLRFRAFPLNVQQMNGGGPPGGASIPPLPPYTPFPQAPPGRVFRFSLTALLRGADYAPRGVTLHWADMNDWDVTVANIKSQFVQAWQLMRENRRRSSAGALQQVRQDAYLAFLGAEIQRWDQILSNGQGASQDNLPQVQRWLSRVLELFQEAQDRGVGTNEVNTVRQP